MVINKGIHFHHCLTHTQHQQPIIEESPGEVEILDEIGLKLQALIFYFTLLSPFSPTEQININKTQTAGSQKLEK